MTEGAHGSAGPRAAARERRWPRLAIAALGVLLPALALAAAAFTAVAAAVFSPPDEARARVSAPPPVAAAAEGVPTATSTPGPAPVVDALGLIIATVTSTPGPAIKASPLAASQLPPTPTPTPRLAMAPPAPPAQPTAAPPPAPAAPAPDILAGTRDKRLWPFASDSIWNMPIGSGATFTPAGIGAASAIAIDEEYFAFPSPSDPVVPLYTNGIWGAGRCQQATLRYSVSLPDSFVVADASPGYTPNAPAAILSTDGRTLHQMNPVSRCQAGGPLTAGWLAPDQDIYGPGIYGAHGGSGLSSIGGSIRLGELTGAAPIRHALKVNLWGARWLSPESSGHRWPAVTADAAYADAGSANVYGGAVPALRMGALLALPPGVDLGALGLKTAAAKKLAWTLQNYGAYVVDNTTWNAHALDVEAGVAAEFRAAYGYGIEESSGPWYEDVMRIFSALSVVDNNGPASVGGGGAPRQPLAPPIGN